MSAPSLHIESTDSMIENYNQSALSYTRRLELEDLWRISRDERTYDTRVKNEP